jgi:hypothetical protein
VMDEGSSCEEWGHVYEPCDCMHPKDCGMKVCVDCGDECEEE